MDEQLLQDLFDLTTEGAFSSFEEFKSFIETDGENAFNDIYELTIDGAFGSQDEYNTFVSPLKKKTLLNQLSFLLRKIRNYLHLPKQLLFHRNYLDKLKR
jgi:hypothetical protein